jgi:dolichol-phosphate mannosyltransferase
MAGFFGFPRSILNEATQLVPIGYKIGLEILVKAKCRRVVEIPIAFAERVKGESKLSLKQQVLYLQHLR